jgi:hypothetical protein
MLGEPNIRDIHAMRIPVISFYLSLLLTVLPVCAATQIAGIELPDSYSLDGKTLALNGAGVRSKLFVKVYIGALYLQQTTHDAATALADTGPGSMQMVMLYKQVGAEKITHGWEDGMAANLDAATRARLADRLKRFNSWFSDLVRGDHVFIDYIPGQGTRLKINDAVRGTIEGSDFFQALLKVWLGSDPADPDLKQGLLGQ